MVGLGVWCYAVVCCRFDLSDALRGGGKGKGKVRGKLRE